MRVIGIDQLQLSVVIGVYPHEKKQKQLINLHLKVYVDEKKFGSLDKIENTIDYCALSDICQQLGEESHFALIETFAETIAKTILNQFCVERVWVRVDKPAALPQASLAFVEYEEAVTE